MPFRLACIQTSSTDDMAANLATATRLVYQAADDNADFIALPEVFALIQPDRSKLVAEAVAEQDHPALAACRELAMETGAWLLAGSFSVRADDHRVANRSLLLDPEGDIRGRYDKIHMFDVNLGEGETYRESDTYRPGAETCLASTPWGILGMTICYDLRFPQLYRSLAQAGADFLSVPSAFTRPTGRAHWSVLLRARAIETGCYVFAPAQCGEHGGGRKTYGHSLIVDPWGEIIAEAGEETGVTIADIDPEKVAEARAAIPSLLQDRPYLPPSRPRDAK
jgi:deaminated glutathione amidase